MATAKDAAGKNVADADTTQPLNEYFVLLPDLPAANRSLARPAHLSRAVPMILAGEFMRFGGAYLEHHPSDPSDYNDDTKIPFRGSAMVATARSEEELWEKLREDPYVKMGVWDLSKTRVVHFKTGAAVAYPKGLWEPEVAVGPGEEGERTKGKRRREREEEGKKNEEE